MNSNNSSDTAGGIQKEDYAAVRHGGAGLANLSTRGRFEVSGSEAVLFLNGLITNDMKTLGANNWMLAAFPNVQGRLIAVVRVARLTDETSSPRFFLDTEETTHDKVLKAIERFTLAGDFKVVDATSDTSLLTIQGKQAPEIIQRALGIDVRGLSPKGVLKASFNGDPLTILHATHTAEDGFDLLTSATIASSLEDGLIKAGAVPIANETFETMRIEAGVPKFGIDMDDTNVVSETNLDEAISFTKGCYIGQEIIARIKYRGHVAKKLTGLLFDAGAQGDVASPIKFEGKDIGRITSVTYSPSLGRSVALAYVRYERTEPGTRVTVIAGDREIEATVHELPFVRGSWYPESVMTNV
ncbi:MAG TPA: glycine cleavage T C-terminal barrel domain-containing protein [Pyrinomonadaceae bacterium]|nr:glycine cleavage T C-terminal barrel domain-containing protein [Pyrinomonadaceae bacterium]